MQIKITIEKDGQMITFEGKPMRGEIRSIEALLEKLKRKIDIIEEKTETETQIIEKGNTNEKDLENIEADIVAPPDDGDKSNIEVQE